ncbi:hypothetical protein BH10BAC2_BH10BAC2_06330 [soil metagenome]
MGKKYKSEREKKLLLHIEKENVLEEALRFSNKRFKRFDEVIMQLYAGENLNAYFITDKRIWKISECFTGIGKDMKSLLKDVLIYLDKNSVLVSDEDFIQAIFNIVKYKVHWQNNIFEWKPLSKNATAQMNELADYLLCKYSVPKFLYKAFFEKTNRLFINWFIHLGTGRKVREMKDIPIPFTQKMGHYFIQAPVNFSIAEALRWAQVRGLGGDEKLSERITTSWLGYKAYGDENFWQAFLMIIIQGGMFNPAKLTELTDYVREAKRLNGNYHLKGRTLQSLLRQSDEWHNRFKHIKNVSLCWKPCGVEGFRIKRKEDVMVLEELTESKQLSVEGQTMKHCVASYAFYCAKGRSAIFSMRKYAGDVLLDTVATIEINLSLRRIVQAKAKMNKPVSDEVRKYMLSWAETNALAVSMNV